MKDNILLKFKTLEKLIKSGYDTDEKIKNIKLTDVWKIRDLTSVDLKNIKGLMEAIKTKKLIAFFSGVNERKEEK